MNHITLNTGHTRVSPRSEVVDDVVASLRPVIAQLLQGEQVGIPATNTTLTAEIPDTSGHNLLAVVWDSKEQPLVLVGIGVSEATPLWEELHRSSLSALATSPDSPPEEPWCAARLEPAAIVNPAAMQWLGDFERCLAWAWIERRR